MILALVCLSELAAFAGLYYLIVGARGRYTLAGAIVPAALFSIISTLALVAAVGMALAQKVSDKPQVKRSEAWPMILKHIDEMSHDVKKHMGVELSQEQKTELAKSILSGMETQGTYNFIDP